MLSLNETMTAYDLVEALGDESGKFEVTTPSGEQFFVTCKSGHSISNLRPVPHNGNPPILRIRKVAELQRSQETAS
jgi:hypothetical protein